MKYHRPITELALACLLFLGVALEDTPALAVPRVEALKPAGRRALWVGWMVSALNLAVLLVLLLSFGEELIFGVPLLIRVFS